jgi:hypothetical protein
MTLGDFLKRLYQTGLGIPPLKKGGRGGFQPTASTHKVQIPPHPPLLKGGTAPHSLARQVSLFPEITLNHNLIGQRSSQG